MLADLKREAFEANLELPRHGLVHLNFGNASAIDRSKGIFAIKPSGVGYKGMKASDMVLVDLDGRKVEGRLNPSSDTPTHLELYKGFGHAGGIVHTHSLYATAFAQAAKPLPVMGTTHSDFFRGPVPVTRRLTRREMGAGYERETGRVILERFSKIDPDEIPSVLVVHHGPFSWGATAAKAVENAVALELCARLAFLAMRLVPTGAKLSPVLLSRHFERKHGPKAYYGQG